uniref:Uncharacterized protein n=1 Tax=Oryzias sinensis TaxID=183150 RepID=A0A8C8DI62_9TELE
MFLIIVLFFISFLYLFIVRYSSYTVSCLNKSMWCPPSPHLERFMDRFYRTSFQSQTAPTNLLLIGNRCCHGNIDSDQSLSTGFNVSNAEKWRLNWLHFVGAGGKAFFYGCRHSD